MENGFVLATCCVTLGMWCPSSQVPTQGLHLASVASRFLAINASLFLLLLTAS